MPGSSKTPLPSDPIWAARSTPQGQPEPPPSPHQITMLLEAASAGDVNAPQRLLPLVYDQLRKLAQSNMNKEAGGGAAHTLQPTALVHEAYIRLVGGADVRWNGRGHFFGAAAIAMRRILVDRARARNRDKRGGGRGRVELGDPIAPGEPASSTDLLALDEVLRKLEVENPRRYQVVMLRYFAGLSNEDTALAMGVSAGTVKTDWAMARVWLFKAMVGSDTSNERREPH